MSLCPPSVRIAVPSDREDLFAFFWEAHEEMNYASKDADKVKATIWTATTVRKNPVFGVIRGTSGIEAAIGLYFSAWWYSNDPVLMSFTFYVHPDHRRTSHASDLREFAAWFAEQIEMPLVLVHLGDQSSKKATVFQKNTCHIGSMFARGLAVA